MRRVESVLAYLLPTAIHYTTMTLQGYSGRKGAVSNSRSGRADMEEGHGRRQKAVQDTEMDQSSGGEYEMSD